MTLLSILIAVRFVPFVKLYSHFKKVLWLKGRQCICTIHHLQKESMKIVTLLSCLHDQVFFSLYDWW